MSATGDFSGPIYNLKLRRGTTYRDAFTAVDASGTAITTISAARMTIREGLLSNATPGSAVSGLTITPTNTGSTITVEMTPAQTRLLAAGDDYWYQIEFDTADSRTWTLCVGTVEVSAEGVS